MNNNSEKYIISQIENVITNIFENGKINKDTQDELFHAMTMLADVNAILRGLVLLRKSLRMLRYWRLFTA